MTAGAQRWPLPSREGGRLVAEGLRLGKQRQTSHRIFTHGGLVPLWDHGDQAVVGGRVLVEVPGGRRSSRAIRASRTVGGSQVLQGWDMLDQ